MENLDDGRPARDSDESAGELEYYRRLVEQNVGRMLSVDAMCIGIRNELEQKRRGFRLMAELAVSLGGETDFESVFISVSRRLNSTLNMQRTALLFPDGEGGYRAAILQGYPASERDEVMTRRVGIDDELLDPLRPILVTGADSITYLGGLREALKLPYLIAAPVLSDNKVMAVLITGRLTEEMPFLPRLGESDVETVQTVSAYLAAMVTGHRLRQAENLAKHDPLTRLPNLRGTIEQLHHTLAVARRGGVYAAVMFVDLDDFKAVNDTHGHAVGDSVLHAIAHRLNEAVRESDFVGRIGGDEFLVVLSNIRRPENAGLVAKNLVRALSEPINVNGIDCRVGVSIGIAIFPDDGSDETTLIREADKAMYTVKGKGKNSFAFVQ